LFFSPFSPALHPICSAEWKEEVRETAAMVSYITILLHFD